MMQAPYSELTFQLIVESMPSAVVLMNGEGSITYVNNQTEKLFGYFRQELIGQKIEILIPGRFRHNHPKLRSSFFESPGVRPMGADRELYALRKDGAEIPVEIGLNPMRTDNETLVLASIIDITERKTANEKIIHANRLYSFLSHINQTIVHSEDKQSLFNDACQIATEIGKFKMAWIGMADTDNKTINLVTQRGLSAEDINLFKNFPYETGFVLNRVITTGEYYVCNNIECEFPQNDWKTILLSRGCRSFIVLAVKREGVTVGVFSLAAATNYFFNSEEIALLTEATEDISFAKDVFEKDKKKAEVEQAFKQSAANINLIFDIIPQAVFAQNTAGKFIFANKSFLNLYNVSSDALLDKKIDESWLGNNMYKNSRVNEAEIINSGKMRTIPEMRFTDYLGNERIFYAMKLPYTVPVSNEKAVLTIALDITEQKEAERERERIMTDLVERNRDLEHFAHILSHNVRAPLSSLLGLTSLAKEGIAKEEQEVVIEGIATSANQLDKVIIDLNEILNLKRDLSELKTHIRLQDVFDEVEYMLTTFINDKGVQVETDFSRLGEIVSVRSFINSIFYNLMSNAIKFSNPEVKPCIHISSKQANGMQYLQFKDNGLGIDLNKYGSQVFGIYKRFHSGVEGRGIGLFMVRNQVQSLKGQIEVESKPGIGCVFTISFPLSE
jgi:PAS domain S-box-containing protein